MAKVRAALIGVAVLVLVLVAWPATASAASPADVNLIFIHHSVGSDWLSRALCAALNANGYHVADTNYGWPYYGTDYGSHTDTGDWPDWFTDTPSTRMDLLYPWMSLSSGTNTLDPASGENTIVMFKSCFPNSDVGSDISDEKAIYNSLIPYFEDHPDRMFVLITPPPMQSISYPLKTRELCNWLTDREAGWLKDLTTSNAFVFDFYNVLTAPGAHHYLLGGVETHTVVAGQNTLYYDSSGDDHPNTAGDIKAANEYVPLLNLWYDEFAAASGSAPRRVQQTDSRITYLGDWRKWSSSLESGGSIHYTSAIGAAALVSFNGPTFELIAKKGPNSGEVSIKIDDEEAVHVDLYSDTYAYRQNVYARTDLEADIAHTAVILCDGTQNPASGGRTVNIDALRVVGALNQSPPLVRYQQNDAHFIYMGPWVGTWTSAASGGSYRRLGAPGCALNVSFDGTYLAWIAKKGRGYGKALVSVDGEAPVTVDLYSPYDQYRQRVWDTGLLPDEHHTVSIYWVDQKYWAATSTALNVDAVDLLGTLTDGSEPTPIEWRYQQSDARLTRIGTWSTVYMTTVSGGSYCAAGAPNAGIIASFRGPAVMVIARTAPWYGEGVVTLDGDETPVDFRSDSVANKQVVFEQAGLSPGAHTLSIRCVGTVSPGHTGTTIDLDALDITGYLTQAPTPVRTQQDDAMCSYEGTWVTTANPSASGGTFVSIDALEAQVTVAFTGSYLAWVTKTCGWYGKAEVVLDGGTPVTVDLYSRSTVWKNTVYRTGLLKDEAHTLVIRWLGSKNSRSSGTGIGVDAFDMISSGA